MSKYSKNKIKVIIIGLGRMGRNHLRVIADDKRFEIVGLVDKKFVREVPEEFRSYDIFSALTDALKVKFDCAVIAVPTHYHFDIAKAVVEKGKHILIEKPICRTSEQAKKLLGLAKKNKSKVFVGHVERFNPAVQKLNELIHSGALGKPIHFSFTRVGGYPFEVDHSNNVLLDLAVHDLDVLGLLAKDMRVYSSVCHSSWRKGVLDTAEILLKGKNDTSASVHVNWITPTKIRSLRVTGTKGVCFVDYILQTCTLYGGNILSPSERRATDFSSLIEAYRNSDRIEFGVKKEEPLKLEIEAFYNALNGKTTNICSGYDGLLALSLAEEAIIRGK
jgi:UDP-N-acetylglucosamine 3-dehydrogenase